MDMFRQKQPIEKGLKDMLKNFLSGFRGKNALVARENNFY